MQNIKQTTIKWAIAGSVILLLAGCDRMKKSDPASQQNQFYYSNPTQNAIHFKLDDQHYHLAPGEHGKVTLSPGEHTLENSRGQQYPFILFKDNQGGILNPNHYIYYLLTETYAPQGASDAHSAKYSELEINGHLLKMPLPVQSTNATFIDGKLFNCTYPIGTAFPDKLSTTDQKDKVKVKTKCFDKPEVIRYLASDYQINVATPPDARDNQDSVSQVFKYDLPTPAFANPQIQQKAEKLNDLAKTILQTTDPNIHDKLNDQIYQSMRDFNDTAIHAIAREKQADQPRLMQEYDIYTGQISHLLVYGVLPKPAGNK